MNGRFKAVGIALLAFCFLLSTPCIGAEKRAAMEGEVVKENVAKSDDKVNEAESGHSPSISFSAPNYTFKKVVEGVEVTHEFSFVNKGDAPLHIQKVRTG